MPATPLLQSFFYAFIFLTLSVVPVAAEESANGAGTMPQGAILLFGEDPAQPGTTVNRFRKKTGEKTDWKLSDGCLIATGDPTQPNHSNHAYSEVFFRDAHIHAEFLLSDKGSSNSGLYIHGNYEMQVVYTDPKKPDKDMSTHDIGALYGFYPPIVNAALPRDQWQTYDIDYTAPRRDENGKIVQPGRITATLNGKIVQNNVAFDEPKSSYHPFRYGQTPNLEEIWQKQLKTSEGPLFLQDHGNAVKYRNVWVLPRE